MEIVTIEKKTFELWKQRFENFVGRVDALCDSTLREAALVDEFFELFGEHGFAVHSHTSQCSLLTKFITYLSKSKQNLPKLSF